MLGRIGKSYVLSMCIMLIWLPIVANASAAPAVSDPLPVEEPQAHTAGKAAAAKPTPATTTVEQLRAVLRKFWIDHGIWTRNYIVSFVAGMEDQEAVLARLLQNQQDIGNALKPYYGKEAGNKLTELLREHILIAGKLFDAIKRGHLEDTEKYKLDWYWNAKDIAVFLSKLNPNWPAKQLQELLEKHLQLVTDDLNARLNKDWPADIAFFDQVQEHLIRFADVLANGIAKQFPQKFGGSGK
ncbi:glycosyltransferase [Paenibacillus puldeungensis]|uniref:Glycosyltransferase n=1 Tax=Paenibacillus puldeungensis TaxID=696536 RepID=A0ABW3RZY2_9BACL